MEIDETVWPRYRAMVPRLQDPEPTDIEAVKLREAIIEHYLYLVKRVVSKMKQSMPAHVEREDLESFAHFGILQAVQRYDHELGVPFEAYVTQNIWSKVRDGIRDADWAPRSLRKKQREITSLEEEFKQQEGRSPTTEEIAEKLDLDVDEVRATKYRAEIATHAYIEGSTEAQNKPSSLNDEEDDLVLALKQTASAALRDLPPRLGAIIALHYYDEKKLSDVAKALRMSEPKVSALHKEAVQKIWERLESVLRNE